MNITEINITDVLGDMPPVYLTNKRKELKLSQEEFASLLDMSKDVYRKYEEGSRKVPDNLYRLIKKYIECFENVGATSSDSIALHTFVETTREECLTKIFCGEQHDIVNLIFDYLIRKAV